MLVSFNNKSSYEPQFGKFIKIQDHPVRIEKFREQLKNKNIEIIQLGVQKNPLKKTLYLFSGKDSDKFIDISLNMYFAKFRRNVEKYFPKKPKKMSLEKAIKKLKKGYFDKKALD